MASCAVATCSLKWSDKKKFVSYYQFPASDKLKRKWIEACKRKDIRKVKDVKPWHRICSMHFASECFNFHLTYETVKLYLKPKSCPTLNLPRLGNTLQNFITYEDHIE